MVGSFSKTYAMTGWRIGFAIGDTEVIGKTIAVQGHATSNPTSFAMHGALAALTGAEPEVRRMIAAFERRRDFLVGGLERLPGLSCQTPPGAFYAFPHVAEHYRDGQGSLELAEYLLEQAGLAVVPGVAFGADEHIRISFACSRTELEAGLERLEEALGA